MLRRAAARRGFELRFWLPVERDEAIAYVQTTFATVGVAPLFLFLSVVTYGALTSLRLGCEA